jgi:hypothetical protein
MVADLEQGHDRTLDRAPLRVPLERLGQDLQRALTGTKAQGRWIVARIWGQELQRFRGA